MAAPQTQAIGDWTFAPDGNELSRGAERRRLEDRASRTLALLAARPGETVSQAEIVAAVWNGRLLSANSVAVVIGDLRRALGDDARRPRYIETVAKRGYRLIAQPLADQASAPLRRRWVLAVVAVVLALAGGLVWWRTAVSSDADVIVAGEVVNATGQARYDPLSAALSEVVVADVRRLPGVLLVLPGEKPAAQLVGERPATELSAKLILWSGTPTLTLTARAMDTGAVIWTGMIAGPEPTMPAKVGAAIKGLGETLEKAGH